MGARSSSRYADGYTHGHCRYGDCSVIMFGALWVDRFSHLPECRDAPPQVCPECDGERSIVVDVVVDGRLVARCVPCPRCEGAGEVPGPHWPFRFPEPWRLP